MAKLTEPISAMVAPEVRGYIDTSAEADGVGVGEVIRRLLSKGIEAEELTTSLHHLGALEADDDVLRSAARQVREAMRKRARTGVASLEEIATLGAEPAGVDKVAPEARDYELLHALGDVAREMAETRTAGETPRPPGAPAEAKWHPDPKVRAAMARAALEGRSSGTP